jgi:hypothetical protein
MHTMLNLKRVVTLGFMTLVICLAVFVFPSYGIASAHASTTAIATASCSYSSCNHKSPVSTGCEDTAVVERSDTEPVENGITVTIQLQFSTSCHAAWGREVFNRTLPSGYTGHAEIFRNQDFADLTCNDSGGDGDVLPGQSVCYTPMLEDNKSQSTFANGWVCIDGGCKVYANTSNF